MVWLNKQTQDMFITVGGRSVKNLEIGKNPDEHMPVLFICTSTYCTAASRSLLTNFTMHSAHLQAYQVRHTIDFQNGGIGRHACSSIYMYLHVHGVGQ